MTELSRQKKQRYARQIILKEVGEKGQRKLEASTVLLVGAGGLGSPIALYLAASGVGHLIVADGDVVALSNLGRQVIHTTARIGQAKVESAADTLQALNPEIRLTKVSEWLDGDNLDGWVSKADLVLDGSDNFETRYRVNAACHQGGKPLVFGAVLGFEGQVGVIRSGLVPGTPCYRCLFPKMPSRSEGMPTCSTAGVIGPLTGVIGSLQATEAIKVLLGVGDPPDGSLLLVNVLDNLYRRIRFPAKPDCPVCGEETIDG
ncbi:MAG: HesA/MoeB/ThiF family protein [Magnetococcales bacterium]|nr:HesA/MoeB/ThiF family protein [Magnetococcales bacterium]